MITPTSIDEATSQPTPEETTTDDVTTEPTPEVTTTEDGITQPTPEVTTTKEGTTQPTSEVTTTEEGTALPTPEVTTTEDGTTQPTTEVTTETFNFSSCVCVCVEKNETLEEKIEKIVSDLKVDTSELSSTKRQKSCAEDPRPTAKNVGMLGVAIIALLIGLIISVDIIRFLQYVNGRFKQTGR